MKAVAVSVLENLSSRKIALEVEVEFKLQPLGDGLKHAQKI